MSDRPPPAALVDATARVEVQNARRDRRNGLLWIAAALASIVLVPAGLGAIGLGSYAFWGGLGAVGAYFWSFLSFAGKDRGPGERDLVDGRVRIEGESLIVMEGDRAIHLPLSGLTGGWTEWAPGGQAAVLSFSDGRTVAVERASEEEAAAFLAAVGAGASARAVRMRGYREDAGGRRIAGCFLALFVLIAVPLALAVPIQIVLAIGSSSARALHAALGMLGGAAPILLVCAWLWSKVRPTWIQIGTDGVLLRGAFRDRFLPHASIVRAWPTRGGIGGAYHFVRFDLRDGKHVEVPAAGHGEAAAMLSRLEAARRVSTDQDRARLLEDIARAGRPVPEWKRALSKLMTRAGYRTAGRDVEEMMRIVEDPAAPREQRVAAALAARPHGGDDASRRIRVAAEACAEPKLRLALEGASTGDVDDALLEALAAPEPPARARQPPP